MHRVSPWLMLVLWLFPLAACKKAETACQKKCKGLLTCYEETRGPVSAAAKSLAACEALCEGKGDKERGKVLASFGTMDCAAWMRRHRAEADQVLGLGDPSRASKTASGAPGESGDHPFPKLVPGSVPSSAPGSVPGSPGSPKGATAKAKSLQERVDRIVITTPRETVELVRAKGSVPSKEAPAWELLQPTKGLADSIAVRNLLNRVERLPVKGRAQIAPKDFASHHLTEKHGVRCQIYEGEELLADMIVGRPDRPGAKGRGGVMTLVRPTGSDQVWRVTGALTYLFNRPAEGWRDASVIHLKREDIVHLSLVSPGGKLVLRRDPNETDPQKSLTNWEIVESEPSLSSLDQNAILRLISVLTHLRAPSFEKDATVEQTGLDKPQATVALRDKGGKMVVLLIGNRDTGRRSAFGQVQGDPRVFQLRHPLDELPEEPITSYRDKTLVHAELNQVVGLVVEKDGQRSEFAKDGTQWKALKPEALKPNLGRLLGAVRLLEGRFSGHELARDAAPQTTGLDAPRGRILVKVQLQDEKPPKTVEILVGKSGLRGDVYVQVKGEREVMLIRKWILDRIWQLPKDWEGSGPAVPPSPHPARRPRVDK